MKKINFNKKKVLKWAARGGTFVLVMAATLFGAYSLIPARQKVITFDRPGGGQGDVETSYFSKFVSNLAEAAEGDAEKPMGLSAKLEDFEITFPGKEENIIDDIKIDGELNLLMNGLSNINLTLEALADYNHKEISLCLGLVNNDFYIAIQDLAIKSSYTSTMEIFEYINELFFDPDKEGGLHIDFDVEQFISDLVSNLDLSSLLSGSGLSLPTTTETVNGNEVTMNLLMEDMGLDIVIVINKDTLTLVSVDLGTIEAGDVTIKGKLVCDTIDHVVAPDDEDYPVQRTFVESISYKGWIDRLVRLFNTRTLGLDFTAQIALDNGATDLVNLDADVDLDISKIIDLYTLTYEGRENKDNDENGGLKPAMLVNDDREPRTNIDIDDISGAFNPNGQLEFGVHASARGQGASEYLNFDLSYFEDTGFLTFNQSEDLNAVMKAKITKNTVSSIIGKLPNIIALATPNNTDAQKVEDASSDLFSFITDSELVKAIKSGDYSGIIDLISDLSSDDGLINLVLSLKSIGLGNNSLVKLVLDSNANNSVLNIDIKNIQIGSVVINASMKSRDFTNSQINKIKSDKGNYDSMAFLDDVFDQVTDILDVQTGMLTLDGTILDENGYGYTINNSKANFDAKKFVGFGEVHLHQTGEDIVSPNGVDHNILFDINNDSSDESARNILVTYNENMNLKLSTTTIVDIFGLFTDLLKSDDPRFTKFGDSILEMLLGSTIANVIKNKDFLEFGKPSYLKSIKQESDGSKINIVINGGVLNLESDISISLNFKTVTTKVDDTEVKKVNISGLSITNLKIGGKTININAGLEKMDETYISLVDKSRNFMDFTQVKVLLDFGINTTKINYYHLTAALKVNLLNLDMLNINLDFHVYVDGKTTKVYGIIPDIPSLTIFVSGHTLTQHVKSELVFEPGVDEGDDIGGIFHILKSQYNKSTGKTEQAVYYRCDSGTFLENITTYLISDMLDIRTTYVDMLDTLDLGGAKTKDPDYSRMFDNFKYTHNPLAESQHKWDIGLNMGALLANDKLGSLTVSLNGKDDRNSGLFTFADVDWTMLSAIRIQGQIVLDNASFDVTNWPTSINNKYEEIIGYYNNLTGTDKTKFDTTYNNNPNKGKTVA